MLKARIILGLIIVGLSASFVVLWQSSMDVGNKQLLTVVLAILYLSACTMMAITFFALDKEGRLPRNSLAFKYFASFYSDKIEQTEDGEEKRTSTVPEYLKLCPGFWMVAVGIVAGAFLISLLPLIGWSVYSIVTEGIHFSPISSQDMEILRIFGAFVSVFVLLIFFIYISLHVKKVLAKVYLWVMYVGIVAVGFYALTPHLVPYARSATEARVTALTTTGTALGFGAGMVFAVVAVVALVFFIFKSLRTTVVGQAIKALINKLCPIIPIEPVKT